jgi:crooked neck
VEVFPENSGAWNQYAEFEAQFNELERARGIYECAIQKSNIDMPENVWKSYIDFEIAQGNID